MSAAHRLRRAVVTAAVTGLAITPAAQALASAPASFIGHFNKLTNIASTVPGNGDVNPYGIVVIHHSHGKLQAGNVLVSNFNNKANEQGTGRTIVQISPKGHRTLFASISGPLPGSCPGGVGLSTALTVLTGGWVVVGSTPSTNGKASTAQAGCLIVLDNQGRVRETFAGHGINGPWDATSLSRGSEADLFVTNVLNGTASTRKEVFRGTVLRLRLRILPHHLPRLLDVKTIGSGFPEQVNDDAFVLGPTGVALSPDGTLYVASTRTSSIAAIANADTRTTDAGTGLGISARGNLSNPLGLAMAPNGHILAVNGHNGLIVEVTPAGDQVAARLLDSRGRVPGNGALFGLALAPGGAGVYYVDDITNKLRLLH